MFCASFALRLDAPFGKCNETFAADLHTHPVDSAVFQSFSSCADIIAREVRPNGIKHARGLQPLPVRPGANA
jgi:hypothetical protein